jgi:hypothetical protein
MHNDFILINKNILKNVKPLSLRSTQSLQWANIIKIPLMFTLMKFRIHVWGNKIKVIVTLFMTRYVQR